MELESNPSEIIKVEVVNFDSIRDNTVKVMVAALAGAVVTTITTKFVEAAVEKNLAKRRAKKLAAAIETPKN